MRSASPIEFGSGTATSMSFIYGSLLATSENSDRIEASTPQAFVQGRKFETQGLLSVRVECSDHANKVSGICMYTEVVRSPVAAANLSK